MGNYLIHERMLCEVTFVRRIEADDIEDAKEAALDGWGDFIGVAVGDAHSGVESTEVFDDAPHNIPANFLPAITQKERT